MLPDRFRTALTTATAMPGRLSANILGALGNDGAPAQAARPQTAKGRRSLPRAGAHAAASQDTAPRGLSDPPWSVMNGAGHRHLLDTLRKLLPKVSPTPGLQAGHVTRALFGPWTMQDKKCSLRFDADSREHAYRWSDPVSEAVGCEAAVQALVVFGLSCLPAVPHQGWRGKEGVGLSSPCCMPMPGGATQVSWPIWRGMIGHGAVRHLLLLSDLTATTPGSGFASRGVLAVMRAERRLLPGQQGAMSYTAPRLFKVAEWSGSAPVAARTRSAQLSRPSKGA